MLPRVVASRGDPARRRRSRRGGRPRKRRRARKKSEAPRSPGEKARQPFFRRRVGQSKQARGEDASGFGGGTAPLAPSAAPFPFRLRLRRSDPGMRHAPALQLAALLVEVAHPLLPLVAVPVRARGQELPCRVGSSRFFASSISQGSESCDRVGPSTTSSRSARAMIPGVVASTASPAPFLAAPTASEARARIHPRHH